MKKIMFAMAMCGMLVACSSTTEDTSSNEEPKKEEVKPQKENKPKEEVKKETPKVDESQFNMYAGSLTGGTFITTTELKDGNKAIVKYADSFAAYKAENPKSRVSEDDYKTYFGTGEAIQKIMVGEPARLLKQFEGLKSVSLTLPFEGKTYTTDITRKELNDYLGFKIESLGEDSSAWRSKFSDKYIYNASKRQEMFNKFVKEGVANVDKEKAAETAKKEEAQKKAEEQKQAELKKQEEAKKLEEQKAQQEAQAKAAEEKRKQDEANRIAEENRVAEQKQKEQEALQAKQQAEAEQARKEAEEKAQEEAQAQQQQQQTQTATFQNCTDVRAAGRAPIRAGEPGFQAKFDRDGDGIGCDQ
ncbi:excalibur calcium-binding domain-containing protein [Priestia megaterium]